MEGIIQWLEMYWGITLFGTLTLGGLVTSVVFMIKNFLTTKLHNTTLNTWFNNSKQAIKRLENLYNKEREARMYEEEKNNYLVASQNLTMDILIKLALSSKLDTDDKVTIVANVERLKDKEPKQLIEDIQETLEDVKTNVVAELKENPEQTVFNTAAAAGTLLDKYKTPPAIEE